MKRFLIVSISCALIGCSKPSGEALPQLGIDAKETSTSGLSAGAYMAGQLQVAHSNKIIGAALVAGGTIWLRGEPTRAAFCQPLPGT